MPIYEYRCSACGHELEAMQKMSEAPLTECPACATPNLRKLISAAGFRLKGSGWYETDFKRDNKKRNLHEGGGGKENATDAGKADTAKSETKTAPETKPAAAA